MGRPLTVQPWASHLQPSSLCLMGIIAVRTKCNNAYKMLSTLSVNRGSIITCAHHKVELDLEKQCGLVQKPLEWVFKQTQKQV